MGTYRRQEIIRTSTTTDVWRFAFGRRYRAIGYVYEIIGDYGKRAGLQPFLTSERACREYIDAEIACEDAMITEREAAGVSP
jgi:hypothetical protein